MDGSCEPSGRVSGRARFEAANDGTNNGNQAQGARVGRTSLEGKESNMIRSRNNSGFTLIELMIVVAIIAIIASIAIPKLMAARLSANEAAAIATLRSVSSAQAQVQSSGAIDSDGDGSGEYGFFGELAGTAFIRDLDSSVTPPVPTISATQRLNPAVLSSAFGTMSLAAGITEGTVIRSGYCFKLYLPGPTAGGLTPGVAESTAVGGGNVNAGDIDPDNAEILWCCYAWPVQVTQTGNRAFFMNQEGDLLQTQNRVAPFTTPIAGPTFDECFSLAGTMAAPVQVGIASLVSGNIWTPVQ